MKFILVFFLSFFAQAETINLQIDVGDGRVKIDVQNLSAEESEALSEALSELETELTIDNNLVSIVNKASESSVILELPKDFIQREGDKVIIDNSKFTDLKIKIKDKLSEEQGAPHMGGAQFFDQNSRVVMGSNTTIERGEEVEELVVLGGSATIKGKVKRLVVLGGFVKIEKGAEVSEELSVIGGSVKTEPGAIVKGSEVDVGVPLTDDHWHFLLDRFSESKIAEFFSSGGFQLGMVILKILALLIFALVGYYIAPEYQGKVLAEVINSPGKSFLWGFISVGLFIPVLMLLLLSLIGLPLMPLQFSLYFLFFVFGYIHGSHFVAKIVLEKINSGSVNFWWQLVVGIVAIELFSYLPIIGGLVKWTIVFMGFGACSHIFYKQILTPPKKDKMSVN